MTLPSTCPHCQFVLDYERDGKQYSSIIGVEIPGAYDGALFWMCPACNGRWHRWEPGTYQHQRAEKYVR